MRNIDNLVKNLLFEEIEKKANLMVEKLSGKQHKIDVAEPKGKITGADFAMLRSMKKKETKEEREMCENCGGEMYEGECMECNEGKEMCEQCGGVMSEGQCMECNEVYEEYNEEKEVEEGNRFTDMLRKTKKGEKFKLGNKTYTDTSDLDETRIYEFTEKEMVDLIERLVIEEKDNIQRKKASASSKLEKSNSTTGKEAKQYLKQLEEKMKNYLKDGSKGKYEMNPTQFPKGNGELGEMSKKAYKASDAVEEYVEAFAYPGLELTHFDEIKPNEEWVESNIKGSSKTGNNPKWANAVETELGEKMNEKRIKKLYDIEKRKGSYKRVKQPIDTAGEDKGEKSLDKMFKTLESTEDKKNNKINEQVDRMFRIISYNQKTQ